MDRNNDDDSFLQLALSVAPKLNDHGSGIQQDTNLKKNDATEDDDDAALSDKVADLFSQKVPSNASDLANADSAIASQMAKLSVTDREQVYMDVHGISDYVTVETPELIEQSLFDLQQEIDILPDKRAYTIAERLDPQYVHDPKFRLMFLRCEKFDCPKTALRIIRHFQMKLDLFGMDKLVMEITQDDLDVDDMDVLYSCTGRFLKTLDRGGRIINFIVLLPRAFKTDAALRKSFYNIMVAFRDEELQRRGAISVTFETEGGGGIGKLNPDLLWKLPKLNEGSPMRISAMHWCWSHEVWKEKQAFLKNSFSKQVKVRIRLHRGSVEECLKELQGHGIDPKYIPINAKGDMTDLQEERQRLEAQRRYERLNFPLRSTVHVPFSQDILLGKGTPFQRHPGNKRLRQLVSDHIKLYEQAEKGEKKAIASGIINTITESGGMFLKQDGSKWSWVNNDVAVVKVSAIFRTFRRKKRLEESNG